MPQYDASAANLATHDRAGMATHKIADRGLDMKQFSIVRRSYHADEQVAGLYRMADRVKVWGARGAYWVGLWGLEIRNWRWPVTPPVRPTQS